MTIIRSVQWTPVYVFAVVIPYKGFDVDNSGLKGWSSGKNLQPIASYILKPSASDTLHTWIYFLFFDPCNYTYYMLIRKQNVVHFWWALLQLLWFVRTAVIHEKLKTDVYVYMLQIGKKYSHHTYPFINYPFNTCSEIVAPLQRFKEQNV